MEKGCEEDEEDQLSERYEEDEILIGTKQPEVVSSSMAMLRAIKFGLVLSSKAICSFMVALVWWTCLPLALF